MQRGGNRMRVNVQLIDAETGNHLWAERFDKPVADLFDMQDEIVARLANQMGTELIVAEARRAEQLAASRLDGPLFPGHGLATNKGSTARKLVRKRGAFSNAPWRSIPAMSRQWSAWRAVDCWIAATCTSDDRASRSQRPRQP